jgi:nucleoside-diphosphate-sugar epimerase
VEKAYVERLLDRFELEHPSVRVVRMRPAFIFREAASVEQRRLFLGPLAPTKTLTSRGVPVLPDPGVVFQALHTDDAAAAYRAAVLREVRGAFNLAAEPPVDMGTFAAELGARTVKVPVRAMRGLLRTAWLARLVPASPGMFDMAMRMPLLDTRRAREELGWAPRHSGPEAVSALIEGMRTARGGQTPPLDPATSGALRAHEFGTGVGGQA